jgi:hypothetical protein
MFLFIQQFHLSMYLLAQLEYQCNPDDSINVFNLPDDSYLFAMQVVTNGNDILCTVRDENATTVTLTGCSKVKC